MDQGLGGQVGRRKGHGQAEDFLPGAGRGSPTPVVTAVTAGVGKSAPSSPSTECEVTNEMEETGTAGGMTWPASHCPLLGRVVPSPADVSSRSQGEARQREKGKGAMDDRALLSGRAFLAPMRLLAPNMGQGPQDRLTNGRPRERCLGLSPDLAGPSSAQ